MPTAVTVTFEPSGKQATVVPGTTVLQAARLAGENILSPCGGKGTCGKCAVRIVDGRPGPIRPTPRPVRLPKGMYLACLLEVDGPLTVRALYVVRDLK